MAEQELCSKCGAVLHDPPVRRNFARLCPRHLREALAASPPFACTPADMAARDENADPDCDSCGHKWSLHTFDGCQQLTARMVFSYGELVEDTGPFVCRCREIDPACQVLPPKAPVARIAPSERSG